MSALGARQRLKEEEKFILNVAEEARLGDLGNLLLPYIHVTLYSLIESLC